MPLEKAKQEALKVVLNPANPLGVGHVEAQLNKAKTLYNEQKYSSAKSILEPTMNWVEEATELHFELFGVLRKIKTATNQADAEKDMALRFAMLRDEVSYQLGLVIYKRKSAQKSS